MRAWTVDADDSRVAEDFDDALLHHTPEIDTFLNLDRDDKFIVIGTKGFGKEAITFFADSPLPWSKLWLTAIAAATLKHLGRADGLRVTAKLTGLMADERLHGMIDHFVRLLDFSPSDLQRAAADTDGHLLPRLRAVNSPVAIFIDGVDEYFNKHIESRTRLPSVTGPLSPSVWYFAQPGLVEVAYQLRRINHHLKVFAAVRKEASARLRADPIEAFLGRTTISHVYTGEEEDAFDYVCRHTLLRPRDLMTIGERLAALRPEERRHKHRTRAARGAPARSGSPRNSARSSPSGLPWGAPRR
jgi:hypothetical protein